MAIKINLAKKGRRLQDLVRGDTLVFPDREETVVVIDKKKGELYTKRIRECTAGGKAEETVLYHLNKVGEDYLVQADTQGCTRSYKRLGK